MKMYMEQNISVTFMAKLRFDILLKYNPDIISGRL